MSVVVGIKKDGVVYLGADSQVTRGGTRSSLSNQNNFKIWRVKGINNCLMGHVGNVRDACVVRVMSNIVREIDAIHGEVDYEYIVRRVVPIIIDELKEYKYLADGVFNSMESRYLFAFQDKLFVINTDGAVLEVDDCVAIGSGESEAIGSLLTTINEEDPNSRIVKAIKASAAHDIYVDYPIVLIDSDKEEFSIITENNIDEIIR